MCFLPREPNPLFSHHRVPINNFHLNSSTILGNTVTPPRGPIDDKGIALPISENPNRRTLNETYTGGASLIKSTVLAKSLHTDKPTATSEVPHFYFPRGKPKPTDMGA